MLCDKYLISNSMLGKVKQMNNKTLQKGKEILSKLIPDSSKLRYLMYLPRLETWRRNHNERYPLFNDRYELYKYLNSEVIHDGPITYLEFGVYKGDSIKNWSTINTHSRSRFFGFDTFTGLPELWDTFTGNVYKGTFDVHGEIPELRDERVSFVKGLFQDTLCNFLRKQRIISQLVINNDSDMYSSSLYLLTRCNDILLPGSIVIFDEFSTVLHEFRSLEDFCCSYLREYVVVGATKCPNGYYMQVAISLK